MRFSSEIFLLLLLAISPLLILGGLSLSFTMLDEWFLLAGAMSIMFALTAIARLHHRLFQPLKTLIENLYKTAETPENHQPPELRQLLQAIRFYSAAGNVDVMNRIRELELVTRNHISAQIAYDLLLKQELEVLKETKRDLADANKKFMVQKLLARETAKKVFALANSNPLGPETVTELENLQFLLTDSHHFSATENHDLLMLIDRVIDITAPLSRMRNSAFYVEFEADCPRHFDMDNQRFGFSFFQLIIGYLTPDDQNQDQKEQIFLKVKQTTRGFSLTFPKASNPKPNAALEKGLKSAGATWNHKTLNFPATITYQQMPTNTDLTAIVVAQNKHERASLTKRLNFLGVQCITDFKNQHLDICIVADETSEVFHAIKLYLPETAFVLMLNNRQHYHQPRWIALNDPVTQTQLKKVVARVASTKKISYDKNILVVDDSEVNIRLLEIQLNELGHNVTIAGNGEVAVALATKDRFEMIFMDIQMPGIDGLEATLRIRQQNRTVPIMGLTAHATAEERKEYLRAGMNDVLIKPVSIERLRGLTQRLGRPDAFPPMAASGTNALPAFDLDMALANAGDRRDLATELFDLLLATLPEDLNAINAASSNTDELKRTVHKLHGAVRYCGVPRLAKAIEKLELALKNGNGSEVQPLLNLLNGEVTALNTWHQDNPDVLSSKDQQLKHH